MSRRTVIGGLALGAAALTAVLALVAFAFGDDDDPARAASRAAPATCPRSWRSGWQELANEIRAPVYCASWLPQPLDGRFGGPFFNGRSVDPDRSYLVSYVWFDTGGGVVNEVHVNLRGYPGSGRVPTCEDTLTVAGKTVHKDLPCWSDASRQKRFGRTAVTVYTANQGADQWHVLYAWRRGGSLYSLSEHVAAPYTFRQVVANLDRMMRRLVLVQPTI